MDKPNPPQNEPQCKHCMQFKWNHEEVINKAGDLVLICPRSCFEAKK